MGAERLSSLALMHTHPKRVEKFSKEKVLDIFLNSKPRRLYNGGNNCYFLINTRGICKIKICKIFLKMFRTVGFRFKGKCIEIPLKFFRIYQAV